MRQIGQPAAVGEDTPGAWFSKGVGYTRNGNYSAAETCFRRTLALAPHSLEARLNLGYALGEQGRYDESRVCYEEILAACPSCSEARYNRAAHLLRAGDLIAGFADYEVRFVAMQSVDRRPYSQPRWDGTPLDGRSILVYGEQGFGDAIQFSRYIPLLAGQGARVILEVQPPLVALLTSTKGVERVVEKSDLPPDSDVHIPILSLPYVFHTTLATIPANIPYLFPPRHLVEQWRTKCAGGPPVRRIGLAWAGKQTPYPNRSCPPEHLAPLFELDGISFYSLQLGERERLPLPPELAGKVIDLTDEIDDFADTAALIENLDLVITIDTAVAHLAGALGKPVWVMLPYVADWRWLEGRDDSPWYPSMRLFRQPRPGDWPAVINEVVQALRASVSHGTGMAHELSESPESMFQTAMGLLEQGENVSAIPLLRKLVVALPDDPAVWFNLGRAYLLAVQPAEAERCFAEVLKLKPQSPDAWFRLGQICRERRDFAGAEAYLRQAQQLMPDSIDIMLELGAALIPQGKRGEAFDLCRRILSLKPDCKEAISNLAHLQLSSGDYLHGFENFEIRLEIEKFQIDPRRYPQPRWDGTPLDGRSILVYGEQGMGDVIMFSRYLPLVAERGGRIVLEADKLLMPLFADFPGVTQVVEKSASPPMTDRYIQSSSLPRIFRTTIETIPDRVPYLAANPKKEAEWRELLAKDTAVRVGLVWRGNRLNPLDGDRSASLEAFAPLADISGVSYYSLQVGPAAEEATHPPAGMGLTDLTDRLHDFSDTAALLANLDLIIGVDTGVAHLAGALAKPVWVLLPHVAEWRWLIDREDSPWYPTMRLFRQERPGEWDGVVERVKGALMALVAVPRDGKQPPLDIESTYATGARRMEEGDLVGAECCFRRIVEVAPDLPDPRHSLGAVQQLQERLPEAVDQYRTAIALDPSFVKAHYNLATALWHSGRYPEAIEALTATLALDPGHAEAHWLLGMLLLLTGDFRQGWQEYEWRWKVERFNSKQPDLDRPPWDGSPLEGKTLLIHMEQGRGDMIQFIRYAPLVAASGGRVVVCAVRELVDLLAGAQGVNQVVDREGQLPPFDVHISALTLPLVLGTTLETIPSQVPYLWPDPIKVTDWRQLMPANGRFRIGLAWSGQEKPDPHRSLPLRACLPLFALDRVDIYSLQIGRGVDEISSLPAGSLLIDHTDRIADFSDTAALIANLDMVITIDTAVAHLAGALGTPVWTLLPYIPDWRWLLGRDDTPWYPTMRLFRQPSPGDWGAVVAQVRHELSHLLGQADFHRQRGVRLLHAGQLDAAASACNWAIELNPHDAEAYNNRGAVLDSQKRYCEAIASYEAALALQPDFVQALFNMGNTYRNLGTSTDARRCYERALELSPGLVPAALCLAELCKEEGEYARAEGYLEQALAVAPDSTDALVIRGEVLQSQERFLEAIAAYEQALAADPDNVTVLNKVGTASHLAGRLEEAEGYFRHGLARAPDLVTLLNNLGALYQSWGRFADSLVPLRRAVAVDPSYADGHWNLALSLLASGAYEEGWQEYEWRFKKTDPVPVRYFAEPCWDGTALTGRTILVHAEQGFGDTIQMVRYVPLLAQQGVRVIVECQVPALKRLLRTCDGVASVVIADEPLPPFDYHLAMMSLPRMFDTTVATIPSEIPYLQADQLDVASWRQRLKTDALFRVGLVWYAKQTQVLNRKRSCPLEQFAPLWQVPGVTFYSLQIGVGSDQLAAFTEHHELRDLTSHIHDFADTAAFMANLDLIITIDTAAAHLAGALGRLVWVVLPHVAEWRWLSDRQDSPWYPTMRLFRQRSAGDWKGVMDSVAAALGALSSHLHEQQDQEPAHVNRRCKMVETGAMPEEQHPSIVSGSKALKIGLAWSGRRTHPLNRQRSCPLAYFIPLAAIPNTVFYSLQVGDGAEEAATPSSGLLLHDLTRHINDFGDTAALIANLDLVISIDTSIAHLAGAMGKPVWLLLPYAADWRWLTEREDSPWYPTMRLFRQQEPGDWEAVIGKVAEALAALNGGKGQPEYHPSLSNLSERAVLESDLNRRLQESERSPANPEAQMNVGAAVALLGRHREALPYYRRALELAPQLVEAHLNLAFSLLALENFTEGWHHLEWRHRMLESPLPPWPMLHPSVLGSHPRGTSLLIHCEQGYGDTLQFIRFVPLLADLGYVVTVTCQAALVPLLRTVPSIARIVPHGELLPSCDLQALLLSLPWLFGTTPKTIPATIPYLRPPSAALEQWRRRVGEEM